MTKRMRMLIEGQLQGLNFRLNAQEEAQRLSLVGFIRTLSDGRIEIDAQGEEPQLDTLLEWCQTEPQGKRISSIFYRFEDSMLSYTEFAVRR
ncbi:acylphosphatase [Anaerolineales bacterium HSG25]|nr:acylphosphatase [Anaerolineales bacterium HSG25]